MMLYNWLLVFHILSVIAWMAGLLYLPRLYVYHAADDINEATSEIFTVMERRLLRIIMAPAMIASWIFGLWLAYEGGYLLQGWFHSKLLAVMILSGYHMYLARCYRMFAAQLNDKSSTFFRYVNEVPTVLVIIIVILVIIKPF